MNRHDPIVEEVRAAREAYAERFAFDLRAICRDLRERQGQAGRHVLETPEEDAPHASARKRA